jgi:hypothetical protein
MEQQMDEIDIVEQLFLIDPYKSSLRLIAFAYADMLHPLDPQFPLSYANHFLAFTRFLLEVERNDKNAQISRGTNELPYFSS